MLEVNEMDIVTTIQAVINTLNEIPVSGAVNLDKMLGCIQVLGNVKESLEQLRDAAAGGVEE